MRGRGAPGIHERLRANAIAGSGPAIARSNFFLRRLIFVAAIVGPLGTAILIVPVAAAIGGGEALDIVDGATIAQS